MNEKSKYGFTEVANHDMAQFTGSDNLVEKMMGLFNEYRDNPQTKWIRAKWERNRKVFLSQGLGIPLNREISADDFDPLNQKEGERKPLTSTPILYSTYENLVSDAVEMQPEAVFIGRSADDGEKADALTSIYRCLMERRNFKSRYNEWVRVRSQYGMAVVETLWDDTLNDIDLSIWAPTDIWFDPLVEDVQDSRAVFKVSHHHPSWYIEHYPDASQRMGADDSLNGELFDVDPEKAAQTLPLYECWYRKYDAKKRRYAVHMVKIAGGVVLENSEKDVPGGMYAHGEYPFIASYYERIDGTPWGMGPIDYLTPVQEYISDMDDLILQNIKASARPRVLVARSANIDPDEFKDFSKEYIEADRIDDSSIRWQTSQPINALALQMYMSKTETLKTESGQNAASRGEVPGSVTAASAISMLQSAGSKRANLSQYNLNNSYADVVRQTVSLMIQYYDGKRVFRLRGKLLESNQTLEFDPSLYKSKGKEWEYDLEVKIQRESAFHTAYTNQTILSFVNQGAMQATDAIQLLDIPNRDAIALAVQRNDKIKQTIQQLMERVQQLEGEKQAAAQENQKLLETAQGATQAPETPISEGDNPLFQAATQG